MVVKISDNIYSPLGVTTAANYAAVKAGHSRLCRYDGRRMGVDEAFTASLIDWTTVPPREGFTRFERLVVESVSRALAAADVDVRSPRVLLILATTKGNVELLDGDCQRAFPADRVLPGVAALAVARHLGFVSTPLVVSNACVSGLSAQITAQRLLEGGTYDVAVVCGADVLSRFVVSGFGSLKALSPVACRPFDIERTGLNLGEAAATIIYRGERSEARGETPVWQAVRGAVSNDAYHISSPSPQGEGCCRAIRAALGDTAAGSLAMVSAHGTATLYNDEMEATAISRAALGGVPVNSLKGYYGHTMGAAGVLETVLTMAALDDGCILGTRGFEELGVSHPIRVSGEHAATTGRSFLKLMSGFGGTNAAMLFKRVEGYEN